MSLEIPTDYDVIIIGTGAAGLGVALTLNQETRILLISKHQLSTGASPYAQGGIAAVMDRDTESIESHIQDTLTAGAGLCDEKAVRFTVENASNAIQWLIDNGVQFTLNKDNKSYHLTKEGGHSERRILHAADKTGNEVIRSLSEQVTHKKNITFLMEHTVIDLISDNNVCTGVTVLENTSNKIKTFYSKFTVLATGGASSVYLHTSNPDQSTGDGIAIAYRAGAKVSHLEFNQFHPTCLYHKAGKPFLISEAVRGEGGILRLPNGYPFMQDYDERKELAPRDVVARAIDDVIKRGDLDYIYLDITHLTPEKIKSHFPTIHMHCLKAGIDITCQQIPVVPAAHYTCGGVQTDLNGQTTIPRLFAVGEVAYTGLHGANRLASNSLLECLVFAASCSSKISQQLKSVPAHLRSHTDVVTSPVNPIQKIHEDKTAITHLLKRIQIIMSTHVGIVRSNHSLQTAETALQMLAPQINQLIQSQPITQSLVTLKNLYQLAQLIVTQAIARKESIGLHYNQDNATEIRNYSAPR